MGGSVGEDDEYSMLKDLKLEIKKGINGTFSLCFWLFLPNSTPFPSLLLRQLHPDVKSTVPFLMLNEKKEMAVFPLLFLHREAPHPSDAPPWSGIQCASGKLEFPLNKWVHVGCEVSVNFVRLYIDGEVVAEKQVTSSFDEGSDLNDLRKVMLVSTDGDDLVEGYIHGLEVLPFTSTVKKFYTKDPPVQLLIDNSSVTDIEEDGYGVWSIIGGKASCRRYFSLDVILLDAFGQTVDKEMEVVASLSYADNEATVEQSDDAEAPLLTSYDGIEVASWDRPSKLINGRASFKLKISQLSSKCDNRLFRIKFEIPHTGRYRFLEVFSHTIRCISRNRNLQPSTLIWKRVNSAPHVANGTSGLDERPAELVQSIVHEARPCPSPKRVKIGQGNPFVMLKQDNSLKQGDEEYTSPSCANNENGKSNGMTTEDRPEVEEETYHFSTDSDSSEATNSCLKNVSSTRSLISDLTVFKYCLGSLSERSLLLKDIAMSASEHELLDFAEQVSLYSGCMHHRHQITISKRLIEEGINAWNQISQNNHHVLWDNLVSRLRDQFIKIASCSTKYLTQQDFELLRKIAGCQELVSQESFEKMWCWLYPIAFALSQDSMKEMWNLSPRWIQGLVTKEEAESSLQGPRGLQDPGTFILRFPTSRSWPHPDAGNLIVTYVASDYCIHHRLLCLDFIYSSGPEEMPKSLKALLLEEHELSRLGRVNNRHYQFA